MTKISSSIYSSYNDFINKNIGEKKIVISVGSGGTSQPFEGATKESLEKVFKDMIFHEFKDGNFSSNYNSDEYKKEYFDFINKFYNELITSDKAFVDFWSTYMMNSGRYDSKYSIINPHYTREGKSVDYKDLEHYPDSIFYKYKNEMSSGLKKAYVEYMKEYAGKDIDLNKDANKKKKYTRKDGDIEIIATKNTLNIQASKGMLGTTSYPKAFEQLRDASNVVNKQEKIKINFNPVIMPTEDAFSILNKLRKYAEDYGFKLESKLSDNGKDEIEDIDIAGESYAFLINKNYNPELPEWLKVGNKYDVAITEYKNGEFVPTGIYKEMTLKNVDKWVLGKNGNEKGIVFEIEHSESATITSIPYSQLNHWIDNNMIKIIESIPVEKLNNDIKEKKVGMKKINTYSVKNWSEIPTVWKNAKEVKKVKYTNSPFDKDLMNMLEPIVADDDLRPVMNGVNFDEYGITGTNAHILVSLPYPNEKYKGTYATVPKRNYVIDKNSDVKIKDSVFVPNKYPQYPNVIPKIKDALRTNKINVYKLLQWTEVALKYCNKGSFNVLYWFGDTSISFNAKFMIDSMKLLLKLGYSEVYCSSSVSNRAVVFSPDKKYELGKSVILLLMPVIKNAPDELKGGSFDIDFSRELLAYYDFSTDEIRNADDSVANFKMFYGDYDVMPENEIKMLNKFADKNTVPILDYFAVIDSEIHASDNTSSLLIKQTDLHDGIYGVLDGAIELNETIDSDEYPLGFEVENPMIKFIISSNVLDHYINLSLLYVNKDKYFRPEMSGILFDYKDSKMFMVSTNASVLSKIDITKYIEINKEQKDFKFILSVNNLTKFFNNIEDSAITISASDKVVSFENNDYIFSSKLITAKALNYDSVISFFNDKKISLSKKELLECLKSDTAQKFIKKYKKEKLVILDEFDTDGKLNIFIGKTSSYTRDTATEVEDKEKIGTISYAIENGTFQITDSTLLIMPVRIEGINLFALDVKYLTIILDSLNCDSFSFLNKGTDRGYFVTGSCLDYGKEIKPIASYKSKIKEHKEDTQIEELEMLIELLKEVVAENPKDLDSSDALELYEETLVELKKVNADKFAHGGEVGCGCKHSFKNGGSINSEFDIIYNAIGGKKSIEKIVELNREKVKYIYTPKNNPTYYSLDKYVYDSDEEKWKFISSYGSSNEWDVKHDFKWEMNNVLSISNYNKGGSIDFSDLDRVNHNYSINDKAMLIEVFNIVNSVKSVEDCWVDTHNGNNSLVFTFKDELVISNIEDINKVMKETKYIHDILNPELLFSTKESFKSAYFELKDYSKFKNGGELKKEKYYLVNSLKELLDLSKEDAILFIEKIIKEDCFYKELQKGDYEKISKSAYKFCKDFLYYNHNNPIKSKLGDFVYFDPDKRTISRDGYLLAQIKYSVHQVTRFEDTRKLNRVYDKSKDELFGMIASALFTPDSRAVDAEDENKVYYYKEIGNKKNTILLFEAVLEKDGHIQYITVMPNKKNSHWESFQNGENEKKEVRYNLASPLFQLPPTTSKDDSFSERTESKSTRIVNDLDFNTNIQIKNDNMQEKDEKFSKGGEVKDVIFLVEPYFSHEGETSCSDLVVKPNIKPKSYKKGDVVYFKKGDSEYKNRGEILDTINLPKSMYSGFPDINQYIVSNGIKSFNITENKIIGLAPKKEVNLFDSGISVYDERISDMNATEFYLTYAIGYNPFEVSYDKANEYGYGIYAYDTKESNANHFVGDTRMIKLVPSVKKPLIFLNDNGSSFNAQYKEAYDNAVKYDGVKSKDEFTKKMIEQGYDSMLISDIHGLHLILFYNDPELYSIKSDLSN